MAAIIWMRDPLTTGTSFCADYRVSNSTIAVEKTHCTQWIGAETMALRLL